MMKTLSRLALSLSLIGLAATSVEAAPPDDVGPSVVRVVNNYSAVVQVYAEDAHGHMHRLGRVGRGDLVEFDIPADIAADAYRIKVYPHQPVWSQQYDDFGVKTNPLDVGSDADVTVWVEPDLRRSIVETVR